MKILRPLSLISFLIWGVNVMAQSDYHIYDKSYLKSHQLSAAVTEEVTINASRDRVWEVISNWGEAHVYTPGLDHSYCTTESTTGPDSKRHCDIGKGSVEEEVLLWEEGQRFIQRVYAMQGIPMVKAIVVELEVTAIDETTSTLTYSMAYKMPLGKLMRGRIRKNVKVNAYATKHYVETGDYEVAKDSKQIKQHYF